MRIFFKPMPWLTLLSCLSLTLLLKLGFWQKDRLAWKLDLLEQVELAANAEPITSLGDIQFALDNEEFVEFRRVYIEDVSYSPAAGKCGELGTYYVFTARNRDETWRKFFLMEKGGVFFFSEIGLISQKDRMTQRPCVNLQSRHLIGYVRTHEWQDRPKVKSTPELNRWFAFNPMPETDDWARRLGYPDAEMRFYIETVDGYNSASKLPPKRPDIRNNHFDYMLTWFSMAILLIIFYVLIHIKNGQVGLNPRT